MADYYAVLGVDRRASAEEIKKAFRRLTREYHPDRNPGDTEVQDTYRQINEAYNVLGDATARARYDAQSRIQQGLDLSRGFDATSARDLLGNVFGDVFRSRRKERRRGRDLRYTLTVSLRDSVLGGTHDIEFDAGGPCSDCDGTGTRPGGTSPQTCPVCQGKGEVKGDGLFAGWTRCGRCDGTGMLQIDACEGCKGVGRRRQRRQFGVRLPPGTSAGAEKIIAGAGEPGRFGGEPGDLRITVNVTPDPWLQRQGHEIVSELPVSISEAALGARVTVPTVDGAVTVDVPAGIRSGTKLRLRGKGVPIPRSERKSGAPDRGDQLLTVVIETPQLSGPALHESERAELHETLARLESLANERTLPRRASHREQGSGSDIADEPG